MNMSNYYHHGLMISSVSAEDIKNNIIADITYKTLIASFNPLLGYSELRMQTLQVIQHFVQIL